VFNALTFLVMLELGAGNICLYLETTYFMCAAGSVDGMAVDQKTMFKNIMRGVAVMLVRVVDSMR
jgi:hypothetical protein